MKNVVLMSHGLPEAFSRKKKIGIFTPMFVPVPPVCDFMNTQKHNWLYRNLPRDPAFAFAALSDNYDPVSEVSTGQLINDFSDFKITAAVHKGKFSKYIPRTSRSLSGTSRPAKNTGRSRPRRPTSSAA